MLRERQRRQGGGCPGQEGIPALLTPQDWLWAWGWERWLRWSRSPYQEDTCSQVSKPHRLGSGFGPWPGCVPGDKRLHLSEPVSSCGQWRG